MVDEEDVIDGLLVVVMDALIEEEEEAHKVDDTLADWLAEMERD